MALSLNEPSPPGIGDGLPPGFDGPRGCGPYDLAPTLDLINLVFRTDRTTGRPQVPTMGWDYTHIYNQNNLDNVRIVCHRGRPVSSVGIHPTTVRTPRGMVSVGGINAVATHPDFRRRGLNTATLKDSHDTMRAAGIQVGLLSTGISNYYRKLGWERAGQQRTFTFDRRNVAYLPAAADLDVSEEWTGRVDQLCALYDAQEVGAVRTPAHFELLATHKASRIFVALRRGAVAAYAALNGASVREYAGPADDVAALLRALFATIEVLPAQSTDRGGGQAGQFEMTVLTPAFGAGLPALLLDLGVPSALTYMGMLVILDAPGLFEALGIDVPVERRDGGWRLGNAAGTLDVSDGELVKIVFGPERSRQLAPGNFPVEFFQWPLDRV